MKIIKHDWQWAHPLTARTQGVRYLIPHNSGGTGSAASIHAYHRSLGWSGVGYNYVVDLDGDIHQGRPEWARGSHCYGYNNVSIGVCFIGNYQTTKTMPKAQLEAGRELMAYLMSKYRGTAVRGHGTMPGNATDCPGRYFPMKAILKSPQKEANVKSSQYPKIKQAMMRYALTADPPVRTAGWEGISICSETWGVHARVLAGRVSGRLHEAGEDVPRSARPTPELAKVLLAKD